MKKKLWMVRGTINFDTQSLTLHFSPCVGMLSVSAAKRINIVFLFLLKIKLLKSWNSEQH